MQHTKAQLVRQHRKSTIVYSSTHPFTVTFELRHVQLTLLILYLTCAKTKVPLVVYSMSLGVLTGAIVPTRPQDARQLMAFDGDARNRQLVQAVSVNV